MLAIFLLLVMLAANINTARAQQAALPLTIDYPLLTRLYIQTVFPEGANKLVLADSRDGCMQLYFSEPKFSMQNGLLLFDALMYIRAGTQLANSCVAPVDWKGIVRFILKPQLNATTFALTFTIVDSKIYKPNFQPDKIASVLWNFAEPFIFKHLQGVAINLAPPVSDLKSFLFPLFPSQAQAETKKMLDTITAGEVRVGDEALSADLLVEVNPANTRQPSSGEAMTKEELQRAIKLWETWDSFLVQMITTLGRYKLTIREQDLLSDVLLDTRYAFIDAVENRKVGEDFVRRQFVEDWKKLAPVFRNHLAQTKKDALLGYLGFFTAADALGVFDSLGSSFGLEISEAGFVRLTSMLGNNEQALKYVPAVNPQLRNVLHMPSEEKGPAGTYPEKEIEVTLPAEPETPKNKGTHGDELQNLRQQLHEQDKEPQQVAKPSVQKEEILEKPRELRPPEPEPLPQQEPERDIDTILDRPYFKEQDLPPSMPTEKHENREKENAAGQNGEPLSFLWDFFCSPVAAAVNPSLADRILEWRVPKNDLDGYVARVRAMLTEVTRKVQQDKNISADQKDMFSTLITAMAWQESCLRQFTQNGSKMSYLLSYNNTSVGIMQVNERIWRGIYDINRLRWDIAYNATAGAEIAALYMEKAVSASKGIGQKKDLLTRAVYAMYNGGPGQLEKFLERDKKNSIQKTDQLFLEKLRWVQGNAWQNIDRCLPDE